MLKLFKGLKPYWTLVIGVLVLVFISTMTDLELPDLMSDIVDTGIVQGDVSYILGRGGVMLLVALLGTVCTILTSYLSSKIGMGFSRDLRKKVFEKVESFSLTEINEVGTASLITRTTNDINQVQMVVIMMMRMMLSAPIMIVGALIMALRKDVELSKVILVVIRIIIVTIVIIAKFTLPMVQKMQDKIDKLNLVVRENLTGIRVIRVFNKVEAEQERFNQASLEVSRIATMANRLMGALMPLMMLSQFQCWINDNMLNHPDTKYWMVKLLDVTRYDREKRLQTSINSLTTWTSKKKHIALCGFTPLEGINMLKFEYELNMDMYMTPLATAFTQSGKDSGDEGGRPSNEDNPESTTSTGASESDAKKN